MLSYSQGPRQALLDQSVNQVLAEAVRHNPRGVALVSRHQQLRLTYQELGEVVYGVARGLWGLGIRPGDRAMLQRRCTKVAWWRSLARRFAGQDHHHRLVHAPPIPEDVADHMHPESRTSAGNATFNISTRLETDDKVKKLARITPPQGRCKSGLSWQ